MQINRVYNEDCLETMKRMPANNVDIIITSPPYWGQRDSLGIGIEEDPRDYLVNLTSRFSECYRILKEQGIMWINIGDAYNTPINWKEDDYQYSTLGEGCSGLDKENSAYTKKRFKRKAFIDKDECWLRYGNLLALPQRLIIELCNTGWLFRGEVIWEKTNPMPEGKCRRPHRSHEGIYLFAKSEKHNFQTKPPVKSVWKFSNEFSSSKHSSRYPKELVRKCINSYGVENDLIVYDPYTGSGTTLIVSKEFGLNYIGSEISSEYCDIAQKLLNEV